jgi:hypothetical protein
VGSNPTLSAKLKNPAERKFCGVFALWALIVQLVFEEKANSSYGAWRSTPVATFNAPASIFAPAA